MNKNLYRIYYILILIHLIFSVLKSGYAPFDENYYAPTGLLALLTVSAASAFAELCQMGVISLILFALVRPLSFCSSAQLSWLLVFLYVPALNYRFSFSHFPGLEMMPLLSLVGFALGTNLREKFSNVFLLISLIYFISGLSKVYYFGLEWFAPQSFKDIVLYSVSVRPAPILNFIDTATLQSLLNHNRALQMLLFAALLFELIFPIYLFINAKLKTVFILFTFTFHFFNMLVLGIYSTSIILALFTMFILFYDEKNTFLNTVEPESTEYKMGSN